MNRREFLALIGAGWVGAAMARFGDELAGTLKRMGATPAEAEMLRLEGNRVSDGALARNPDFDDVSARFGHFDWMPLEHAILRGPPSSASISSGVQTALTGSDYSGSPQSAFTWSSASPTRFVFVGDPIVHEFQFYGQVVTTANSSGDITVTLVSYDSSGAQISGVTLAQSRPAAIKATVTPFVGWWRKQKREAYCQLELTVTGGTVFMTSFTMAAFRVR